VDGAEMIVALHEDSTGDHEVARRAGNAHHPVLRDQAAVAGSAAAFLGLVQYGTGALAAPLAGLVGGGRVVPLGIVVSSQESSAPC